MHLTNYCLNKEHVNYINPQEYGEENRASKRLFSVFFQQLKKDSDFDSDKVKSEIISTIKKTIICLIPYLKDFSKKTINPDIQKVKSFQLIGIDIMLDSNCKAWLMEINANPSMNMFLERQNPNGEYEKTISELDKYLKTLVINDAIKIVRAKKPSDDYGCFEKILPSEDPEINRFYVWDKARDIFGRLGGIKKSESITASQFQRLGRYPELTRPHFVKAHYDIAFKEATRKSDSNYMGVEEFYNAIELVASKLNCDINQFIDDVDSCIQ